MENTPVINKVVVPKKNVLFEVTPTSRVLAAILFITLPFFGFWLGLQYGNLQPIESALTQDSIQNDAAQNIETEKNIQLIKGSPESIKPTFVGFMATGTNVVYQTTYAKPQIIDGLDIQSFESLNVYSKDNPLGLLYAKDIDTVVVGDHLGQLIPITEAEPSTFTVLTDNFALDSKSVFTVVEMSGGDSYIPRVVKIQNADPGTFVVIGSGYAKDTNYVYFYTGGESGTQVVNGADPATFTLTDIKSYYDADRGFKAKDKNNYYDFGKVTTEN